MTIKRRKKKQTKRQWETQLQISIVETHAMLSNLPLIAIPNGGPRSPRAGAILKKMGVTAGVSDLVLIGPRGQTVWIEIKLPDNHPFAKHKSIQSDNQIRFQERISSLGHRYVIVDSIDSYIGVLKSVQ